MGESVVLAGLVHSNFVMEIFCYKIPASSVLALVCPLWQVEVEDQGTVARAAPRHMLTLGGSEMKPRHFLIGSCSYAVGVASWSRMILRG